MTWPKMRSGERPLGAWAWSTAVLVAGLVAIGPTGPVAAAAVPGAKEIVTARSGASTGTCALLPLARAEAFTAKKYTSTKAATIAPDQDQCTYANPDGADLVIIVYQPGSGVSFSMLVAVLKTTGTVKTVKGVGDKAVVGAIELDVKAGTHLLAVQGAGGTLTGSYTGAIAVAKAVVLKLR